MLSHLWVMLITSTQRAILDVVTGTSSILPKFRGLIRGSTRIGCSDAQATPLTMVLCGLSSWQWSGEVGRTSGEHPVSGLGLLTSGIDLGDLVGG